MNGGRSARPRRLPRLLAISIGIAWRAAPRELAGLIVAQLCTTAAMVVALLLGKHLLTIALHTNRVGGDLNSAIPTALGLTAAIAAVGIARAFANRDQRMLGELSTRYAHNQVLESAAAAELAAFDDPEFHDRIARGRVAVVRLPLVISSLAGVANAAAGAAAAVAALLVLEPLLAPLALPVLVPAWLAAARRGRSFYSLAFALTGAERERMYLAELLVGRDPAKEIRAFELEPFLRARHDRLYERRIEGLRTLTRRQLLWSIVADLAAAAIIAGALLVLIALVHSHDISLAGAGTAAAAIALLGQRLSVAGSSAGGLSESALYIEDLVDMIAARAPQHPVTATPPPRVDSSGWTKTGPPRIAAEAVTFRYPGADRPALQNVSLVIEPREVVALVGRNGSGKTTLAKLIAGLYLPDAGSVRWGSFDTAECDRAELRRHAAVIFQDFTRYALPAYDNIAIGRTERFDDAASVTAAARRAGADRDIERLPAGYDTLLGPQFEHGVDLSLGQWQRVALARVFFRDAQFVILDEPTAALDAEAEEELFAGIHELFADRSVLLISHRFSTVRRADRIYVLEDGAIEEQGTHDELIGRDGLYARLFGVQAAPYR